jgi:membrane-associated protease RseP (regulator of RpoE activity)
VGYQFIITEVKSGSQAASLGISVGDVLVSYDGELIRTVQDLERVMAKAERLAKTNVSMVYSRNGQLFNVSVVSGPLGINIESKEIASDGLSKNNLDGDASMKPNVIYETVSEYSMAKAISTFVSFLGWLGLVSGCFVALLVVLEAIKSHNQGPAWLLGLLPSLGIVCSSLFLILVGQVTHAVVDTAQYARQIRDILAKR